MNVYVAISKEGGLMSGAKGQTVYDNVSTLRKSIGANFINRHRASVKGCKVKDLYDVYEFSLDFGEGVLLND